MATRLWPGRGRIRKDEHGHALRADREARLDAEAKTRAAALEAEREAAANALQVAVRRQFLDANRHASEADWLRLADRLTDEAMIERTRHGDDAARDALRRSGGAM